MTRCGLCRKEIRWGTTTDSRRMAIDLRAHPEGTVYVFPRKHKWAGLFRPLTDDEVARAKRAGEPLFRKHSGNCPATTGNRPAGQMEMTL